MKTFLRKLIAPLFILFFVLMNVQYSQATHIRAGEIIVERVNCSSLTFQITIYMYTDLGSQVRFGDGILRFGDGSDGDNDGDAGIRTPEVTPQSRPDLGDQIGIVVYTTTHTYGAPGKYVISYFENNRNDNVLNIDNSVNTPFFVDSEIIIDPFLGCNNSPVLLIPPIDKGCPGVAFFHNPGAFDPDGDSLSFELVTPQKDVGAFVDNYRDPITGEFYINIPAANETGGEPTFTIDPITGEVAWDAPGDRFGSEEGTGEYNIAFRVYEWRKINGEYFQMGYVTRDMQIIIEDCDNNRPELEIPEEICVEAGTLIDEAIFGFDIDFDRVKIEAFSQIFDLSSNSASISDFGVLQSTAPPNDTARVFFTWQTDCNHVREQPYQVVFKITDAPGNGPELVSFETWNIRVVAPEPEWVDAQLDFATKSVELTWQDYFCANAQSIQIWRRVDSFNYVPGECETGIPEFLGYQLIDEVNPVSTSYLDNNGGSGLNVAAQYCYRLIAVFGEPTGGESIMSAEICVDALPADAPVVTHVTVDVTDQTAGEITVSWRSPFDLNTTNFGTDYEFEVQRGTGLISTNYTSVGRVSDTTFTDTGINTESNSYNYRIILYSNDAAVVGPNDPIDTSAVASSVWLQPAPQQNQIDLFWIAEVPWSNSSQDFPWHYIYRGLEGEGENNLVLIDSVNVNAGGYFYSDVGQFNNTPLEEDQVYCYYVKTQGTYGNAKIDEPLVNKSQMVCVQPSDDTPPCVPQILVEGRDCVDFLTATSCDFSDYRNELSWTALWDEGCQDDIAFYEIYFAPQKGGDYQFLISVTDTSYVDTDLASFARCYQIRAIDRSGNASPFSEPICFDNCPYYELPNAFTPNNDGCNDVFSAYSDRIVIGENGETVCGDIDENKCARFVKSVKFTVFNRWGKEVYTYQSGNENTIYIDWDGRTNSGVDLSGGTYYYLAEVEFDVVDPAQRFQELKGWVQIIR